LKYKVYDSRDMRVLFKSKNKQFCINFADNHVDLFPEDFGYIWIGEIED